jgi:hypothetical protein
MKKIVLFSLLVFAAWQINAQLNYSRVKIYADNYELSELANKGVTLDHGHHKLNQWCIVDISEKEMAILDEEGVPYDLLISDVSSYYAEHINDPITRDDRSDCDGAAEPGYNPDTPENFNLGDMGGYFTYEEYLAELDAMRAAYPDLISEKSGISDFETWEGRPIHWVRISDNPDTDEAEEEEVLYTAIHHAREPMSLSQTIFYMWYLLENYGTNDEVTFLVDHTEMYFVPMINPDGYKYNHTTNPGGGGMHRKNRNPDIGFDNKGVDLNRNYAYHWNESGTSPFEDGDTFAGDSAFSEPETQAIKWFCENHNFKFAFNAHSHGDLLLFPIGWAYGEFAEDHDYFQAYTNHMSVHNGYIGQKSTELYPAAGDSDDWMYVDDLETKPEIFAVTPEVGDAFWPPSSAIIPTCKEMLFSNLVMAHLPHVYGVTQDLEDNRLTASSGYLNYSLERLGLKDGDITISMSGVSGITISGDLNVHDLAIMEMVEDSISYELDPGLGFGDEIKYVIHTDNGTWVRHDTVIKYFGMGSVVFSDDCTDLFNWTGDWALTNETYYSPATCITDSPYDDTYGNNVDKEIELDESFAFEEATYAYVNFRAKWEIESDYDYVQFMASTNDGASWTPLCGNYTVLGVYPQDVDEPLYEGFQEYWVQEEIDLTDYIGESDVRFKFRLITDGGLQMDGFYFDDFSVITDGGYAKIGEEQRFGFKLYPNPANDQVQILLDQPENIQSIVIRDALGREVYRSNQFESVFSIADFEAGQYFVQITNDSNQMTTKKLMVVR